MANQNCLNDLVGENFNEPEVEKHEKCSRTESQCSNYSISRIKYNLSNVMGKTTGFFVSEGTGKTYHFISSVTGKLVLLPNVVEIIRNAVSISPTTKIDGQNAIIALKNGTFILHRRLDWRRSACFAILDTDGKLKFLPLFPQKFDKKLPKGIIANKQSLIDCSQFVYIGNCDRFSTKLIQIQDGIHYTVIDKNTFFFGEENEDGFPTVIYTPDTNISCIDFVTMTENGPVLMHDVPLNFLMSELENPPHLTFEEISWNVQGGKYADIGIRKNVVTLTAHGIFPARIKMQPMPLPTASDDEISDFVECLYKETLKFAFPDIGLQREGIVFRFLLKDGSHRCLKINRGHLETYCKFAKIEFPKEEAKKYSFV